ncbi:MAG: pyrrolo-quinoline quinone [Firmicutes bacterium]|nr:pyrrolo-quinoline quinone [Bacillota bacterium]
MNKKIIIIILVCTFLNFNKVKLSLLTYENTSKEITKDLFLSDNLIDKINKFKSLRDFKIISSKPIKPIELPDKNLDNLNLSISKKGKVIDNYLSPLEIFPNIYTKIDGILTFRGDNLRNSINLSVSNIKDKKLNIRWFNKTSSSSWGGGSGWTGQACVIKWPDEIKKMMNIKDIFKNKATFTEVIYGSLDGKIYFYDLETGEKSRPSIDIENPIKGSVALDPRGYPLLYVGQGIPEKGKFGYRIFNLIDQKLLYFLNGRDPLAYRGWGAFDGSPLINRKTDSMFIGGENGIFYNVKLNTDFKPLDKTISIQPEILKLRYKIDNNNYQGIENSIATYKNLCYFADNGGAIICLDITSMKPKWIWYGKTADDTNASITLEVINNIPYLYTGTEQDKQGENGFTYIRKFNGLNGNIIWERKFKCLSRVVKDKITNEIKASNGGLYGTNIIGSKDISNLVIFTLAGYDHPYKGIVLAIDKSSGETKWKWEMPYYSWSSPIAFYDKKDKSYIIQCDYHGNVTLLEGINGKVLDKINLGKNIESSPIIYKDKIIVGVRGNRIYCLDIK